MAPDIISIDKHGLETESASWAARAKDLKITDRDSYQNASHLLISVKHFRTKIAAWFAPHVEAAMETKRRAEAARKALVDEQGRMESPLVEAETLLKRSLLKWDEEQERVRQEQERQLQEEARKRAEALTLEAAAAMESEAVATGNAEMLQEAQDILEQPIETPLVTVSKGMPRVQGITYRDNWKAHDRIDIKALAAAVADGRASINFLVPNMTALNQFARATKGTQDVPGVRIYNDRQVAARSA